MFTHSTSSVRCATHQKNRFFPDLPHRKPPDGASAFSRQIGGHGSFSYSHPLALSGLQFARPLCPPHSAHSFRCPLSRHGSCFKRPFQSESHFLIHVLPVFPFSHIHHSMRLSPHSDSRRLELLRQLDSHHAWSDCNETRHCTLCERTFSGRSVRIRWFSARRALLRCATPGCTAGPESWVHPGNPLLSEEAWADWDRLIERAELAASA